MMTDPAREQRITRFGLRPLPGASHVTDAQIEQARREARHRRPERIQTANDAVDAYLRESGTRNDPAAFRHIQRARPELFAGTQVPADLMAVANFNPYHDRLGRFTTKDGAAISGQSHPPERRHGLPATVHEAPITLSKNGRKKYDGKLTAGAYKQDVGTGKGLPAVMREAIAQISKLQTDAVRAQLKAQGAELFPDGSLRVGMSAMEQGIRKANPGFNYDFSRASQGGGADPKDGLSTLGEHGVSSQHLTQAAQIAEHLQDGPVLVAAAHGAHGACGTNY